MKFTINREALLKPLQSVIGVVERRQTLPILSNVLIDAKDGSIGMVTTDLEVELSAGIDVDIEEEGKTTVPARKLFDICKALPEGAAITVDKEDERVVVKAGRSRFTLSILPPDDFPVVDSLSNPSTFTVEEGAFKRLIDKTSFAMAQQDVRYYLNGLMLEMTGDELRAVASDGHRLALCEIRGGFGFSPSRQVIVPRKGIMELSRLLDGGDSTIEVAVDENHIRIQQSNFRFTSKLIDGKFPDYRRVMPTNASRTLQSEREVLRSALQRTAILSNEKYRGVRLDLDGNRLRIQAQNPELEEAEEELEVSYDGSAMEIGFNVNYLVDALSVIDDGDVSIRLSDQNSSCLIGGTQSEDCRYVVMPMHL
ncbi:DNA polymerase III subunit beta [Endothiovibrio diazotrophicus]